MLKCALALLVVAAAIDATQAAGHAAAQTACNTKCDDEFKAADKGRERRAGHAAKKTTCLATCQTDFDIADAKITCDGVCKAAFDVAAAGRSRRAGHVFAQTLCEAKCTAAQDVAKGVQAGATCDAGCQAVFDAFVPTPAAQTAAEFCTDYTAKCGTESTATAFDGADAAAMKATCETWYGAAEAGVVTAGAAESGATKACYQYHLSVAVDAGTKATHCTHARGDSVCKVARNRRAGHSVAKDTCDAACGTTLVASAKMACDSVCDAEFAFADAVAKAKEGTRNRRAAHAAAQTACKALCLTPMSDDEKAFVDYNMKLGELATDPKALKDFLTSEAAKCDCAVSTGLLTVCGSACTLSEASSGTFASSAAAVVIAGLAAALY